MAEACVRAVTVNHNTSCFVELLLRTLYLTNDLSGIDLQVTVLDNGSMDDGLGALRDYLDEQGIPVVPTGHDSALAPEKHGAALGRFVGEHDDCSHYLLLDSDAWFVEPDTLPAMLRELRAAGPSTFAVQARIYGYYAHRVIEGRDGVPGAGDAVAQAPWPVTYGGQTYAVRAMPRCSPVCCLVRNTPAFRRAVAEVGFSRALLLGVGEARWYDTMGLLTATMAAQGQGFCVSAKRVNHFTMTGYQEEARGLKERDCMAMLADLRAGRGMAAARFRESDWDAVKS